MKLAIIVPSGDMVHADFAMCLAAMCIDLQKSGHEVALINPKSSLVQKGRTDGVIHAQEIGAEAVLFIDSDMTFPHTTARQLIDRKASIVGVTCTRCRPPIELIGKKLSTDKPFQLEDLNTGLQYAATLGMGIMFIHIRVFAELPKPWFHVEQSSSIVISEDEWFCSLAVDCDVPIRCDTDLSAHIGHIGTRTYTVDDVKP